MVICCILTAGCYQDTPSSPHTVLDALTGLLHDKDAWVRETAADALGKIGDSSAEPFLVATLRDEDSVVREAAARSLGSLSTVGMDATAGLVLRLSDRDRSVRRTAAQALGMTEGTPVLRDALLGLLANPDVEIRRTAAHALSLIDAPDPSVIQALVSGAQDTDADVRQWVVAALGESGSDRALPVLMELVRHDPVDAVRSEAAFRLRFVGTDVSASQLDAIAAKERNPIVRGWVNYSRVALKKEFDSGSVPRPGRLAVPGPSHRYP